MSEKRYLSHRIVMGALLAITLILVLTLSVNAQGSDEDSLSPQENPPEAPDREVETVPERSTEVQEVEAMAEETERAETKFQFLSANTFIPFDDDMTYNYYSAGCMYRTGGSSYTEHTLQLPEGAEIDYLRIYFYDNNETYNVSAYLYAYDGEGGSSVIASASSSGTPGQSSAGSGYFSHIVDNTNEALSLSLYYSVGTNSNLRICGVRVRYQYAGYFAEFMPLINN